MTINVGFECLWRFGPTEFGRDANLMLRNLEFVCCANYD
jgi:hypothetical protein